MKPENVPHWMGGTMIGKALLACKEILTAREEGDRMIILVSDGESFDLSGGNDESVAQTLKREQHRGLRHSHLRYRDPPAEIVNITAMTGGEVFPVDDPERAQGRFPADRRHARDQAGEDGVRAPGRLRAGLHGGAVALGLSGCASFGLRYTPW